MVTTLVWQILLLTLTWQERTANLSASPEPRDTLDQLRAVVQQTLVSGENFNTLVALSTVNLLLDDLDSQLRQMAPYWVDRSGENLEEFEVDGFNLFNRMPRLPPENKTQGQWTFQPVRFELQTAHLFVHAITLKASKTIRLHKVTMIFADGQEHAFLFPDEGATGNGTPFEKRIYLPWMRINDTQGRPLVRKLKAIEFLGSAQDGNFSALLDFKFLAPGIDAYDPKELLEATARLRRYWKTPEAAVKNFPATLQTMAFLHQRIPP